MLKDVVFCHLTKIKVVDTATKTEIDAVNTTSKRVVQKTAEAN